MATKDNQPYFIGIDIGTGSTKAIAINSKGTIIANSQLYYSTQSLHPGYSEQDPEIVWKAFVELYQKNSRTRELSAGFHKPQQRHAWCYCSKQTK